VAASLTQMGVEVTVIESQPHIWSRFLDGTLARYFESYCADRGIRFLTSDQVTELRGVDRISAVATKSGAQIPCDFACIAVGIRPNVELAQEAGLSVDNGVVVDEHMQTSDAGIYAIGDIANYPDPIYGVRRRVEHYGQAEYTGQLAGMNMTGDSQAYDMLTYVWSDIFDLHLEFAGDESRHDEVIVRGEPASNSFTVLYLAGGVMTKVGQLRDPSSNLRQLLMA
jgi:3-phenylpropionate/trans-cinnamate dioxygenase ferredoxin reductase subunit